MQTLLLHGDLTSFLADWLNATLTNSVDPSSTHLFVPSILSCRDNTRVKHDKTKHFDLNEIIPLITNLFLKFIRRLTWQAFNLAGVEFWRSNGWWISGGNVTIGVFRELSFSCRTMSLIWWRTISRWCSLM